MTRSSKIVALAVTVGIVAVVVYLWLRPMPWQTLAVRSEDALFQARAEKLRGYFHPEELSALGITEDTAVRAINEVLSPDLAELATDPGTRQFFETQNQYLMRLQVHRGTDAPYRGYVGVTITEKGPRVLLSDLIASARNMIRSGIGKDNEPAWQARLGAQAIKLKALGVRGYWHISSNQIDEWPAYGKLE